VFSLGGVGPGWAGGATEGGEEFKGCVGVSHGFQEIRTIKQSRQQPRFAIIKKLVSFAQPLKANRSFHEYLVSKNGPEEQLLFG